MQKILIIEDEPDLAEMVAMNLERNGFETEWAADGLQGLEMAKRDPDLILLDIMLPGKNGYLVFKELKKDPRTTDIPVIFMTAMGQAEDKIQGLEIGADDYITKPFSPREMVLRVQGVLRRSSRVKDGGSETRYGPFYFNKSTLVCMAGESKLELTPTEFKVMIYLSERPGQPVTRAELLKEVWGYSEEAQTRTLDTHMKRLRQKLGEYSEWIETARGTGYAMKKDRGGE